MDSFEKVHKELWVEYNRRPYSFYEFSGMSKKGRLITVYTNKITGWGFIFEPHGITGIVIDLPNEVRRIIEEGKYAEFGLRQLPKSLAERALTELNEFGSVSEKTQREITLYAPVATDEISRPGQTLIGPSVTSLNPFLPPKPIAMIDDLLERKFFDELRRKYPQYG